MYHRLVPWPNHDEHRLHGSFYRAGCHEYLVHGVDGEAVGRLRRLVDSGPELWGAGVGGEMGNAFEGRSVGGFDDVGWGGEVWLANSLVNEVVAIRRFELLGQIEHLSGG